jgi:hypothetical protein
MRLAPATSATPGDNNLESLSLGRKGAIGEIEIGFWNVWRGAVLFSFRHLLGMRCLGLPGVATWRVIAN